MFTVRVEVPEPPATEVGFNEQIGARLPLGVTLQDKFTTLLKPFNGEIVIVDLADPPPETEVGDKPKAVIMKSGGGGAGVTVSPTETSRLMDPDTPLIIRLEVPTRAPADVATVSTDITAAAPRVSEGGTNEQLTPGGGLLQDKLTAPLKPFTGPIVIVESLEPPAATEAGDRGEAVMLKSGDTGAGFTVSPIEML